jgi:hypothetical protein
MARMDWNRNKTIHRVDTQKTTQSKRYESQLYKHRERSDGQANRSARYARLQNGSWGVGVRGKPVAGAPVIVYKKDGTRTTEIIDKIVGSRGEYWYCTIKGKS